MKNLVLFQIDPPKSRYPVDKQPELFGRIEERLAAVPGVDAVSAESIPLLANDRSNDDFVPTGIKPAKGEDQTEMDDYVGDQYFATLHVPMLAGRSFSARDTANSTRVAVVNQALAKKHWGGENPIGKTFTTSDMKGQKLQYTITAVRGHTLLQSARRSAAGLLPELSAGSRCLLGNDICRANADTSSDDYTVVASGRQQRRPRSSLVEVRTQQEQIDQITASERVFANLTAAFGVLALVLACIGIYGITAYSVAQRTNEIGIRMALGAEPERVLRMVLGEASWMTAVGVAVGVAAALALSRIIVSLLYGMKAWDPATFAGSAGILMVVALGASWIPARRAASVDPMRALRHE